MNTTTATVITSAIETLQICDRQARKDVDKVIRFSKQVYAVLTSDKAIGYYQIAHEAIGRTIEVFWVIGVTLIDLLDRWIESHESQAAATTEQKSKPSRVVVDPEVARICGEVKALAQPVIDRIKGGK